MTRVEIDSINGPLEESDVSLFTEPLFGDHAVHCVPIQSIIYKPGVFAAWRIDGKSYYVDGLHMDVMKDGLKLWQYTKRNEIERVALNDAAEGQIDFVKALGVIAGGCAATGGLILAVQYS